MTKWRANETIRELNDTLVWPEEGILPCTLLPVGVRSLNRIHTNEVELVFEQPPMMMNMRISNAMVRELNTLADIKIDYEIPLPWLVYRIGACTSDNGVTWQLSRVALYARSKPMGPDDTNLYPIPLPNIHTNMSVCLDHVQTSSGNHCSDLGSIIQEVLESVWAANFNSDLMSAIMACENKRVPRSLWHRIGSYKTIHDVFSAWEGFSLEEVNNWKWGDPLTNLDSANPWPIAKARQMLTRNCQPIKKRVRPQISSDGGTWYHARSYTDDLSNVDLRSVEWGSLRVFEGAPIEFAHIENNSDYSLPSTNIPELETNPPEANDLF